MVSPSRNGDSKRFLVRWYQPAICLNIFVFGLCLSSVWLNAVLRLRVKLCTKGGPHSLLIVRFLALTLYSVWLGAVIRFRSGALMATSACFRAITVLIMIMARA